MTFSEIAVASGHLKVIRTYIDGVLRFGIPPKFLTCLVTPEKGLEKKIIDSMIDNFSDDNMKDMYGTKDELKDGEDFYPFVLIPSHI